MPELPEVQTIASQLQGVLPGRVIKSVQVLREKSFPSFAKASEGQVWLAGRKVKKVWRRAKMIVVELSPQHHPGRPSATSEELLVLLIHLKMTGQLIFQPNAFTPGVKATYTPGEVGDRIVGGHPTLDWINSLPSKHTRVVIEFSDRSKLFFNDQRVFGWVKVATSDEWLATRNRLPPDVVDKTFTVAYFTKILKQSTRSVKLVLLDQSKIGGMGNIYTNDALYLAHTKPTRRVNSLKPAEIAKLRDACIRVIKRGIATGGASENTYRHIDGLGGKYQEEFLIYKREGERCGLSGCEGMIQKIKLGGRGTYYCPVCQK